MKFLVTGAAGMLGTAFRQWAHHVGDQTLGLYLSDEELAVGMQTFPHQTIVPLGAAAGLTSRLGRLLDSCQKFQPDWIIHCAAWTDVDGCESQRDRAYDSNAMASLDVAIVARELGTRVMALSTDFVFDGSLSRPYTEDDQTMPLSVYGSTKLAGETLVRMVAPRHLVVRSSWLFGRPGKNFVDTILARVMRNEPVRVVNDQRGSPTSTVDLTAAMRILAEREQFGLVHVANSGDTTWFELACEVARRYGKEELVSAISTAELGRPAPRPKYSVLDCSRFASVVGNAMPHWRDALQRHLG